MFINSRLLERFVREEEAAGLIEYALILSLVSITAILAMTFMKDQLAGLFSNIGNTVGQGASGACQGQQQQGQCP